MKYYEIAEAARNGRMFRFTGKINELSFENGRLNIDWVFPDAGKPFTPSVDFSYIELAPKYDPCRKFREGDKVRVKSEVNGRPVYIGEDAWEPLDPNEIWEVVEEKETGWVHLKNGCLSADVWHGMLELVTPVEELELYSVHVGNYEGEWGVYRDWAIVTQELIVSFSHRHPHAKSAAEAERDRLNAEYRKEREND